jgi:broad specificity phosphatase PhoE
MKKPVLAFVFALCLSAAASAQTAVYVVRHAEKIGESMNHPSTELSETGKKRAENLAEILRDAGITTIYVTDTVRARETARPLAEALGVTPQIYEGRDTDGLVKRIRAKHPSETVLVVGHENTIGDIIRGFGYSGKISTRYGNLFAVVPNGDRATVLQLHF